MKNLAGKVAFVTGAAASRGMGHAIALRLAQEGANVVISDKFSAPKSLFPGDENWGGLDQEVKEIEALGSEGLAVLMDICNFQDIESAVAKTLEKFGRIDILVHAAAIRGPVGVPVVDLSEKDIRSIIETDLTASCLVAREWQAYG
jgi:NAD(P)-dependent dehydrogenase (short-subunit alcohol dehydrogenase family)